MPPVLLDGGISIRALAEYLGHADPRFTLRIYSHLMPNTETVAAAKKLHTDMTAAMQTLVNVGWTVEPATARQVREGNELRCRSGRSP